MLHGVISAKLQALIDNGAAPDADSLGALTAELTALLGSTDPHERDEIAFTVLATWLERGVYDDSLGALGDELAAGLGFGLGEAGTDSVFRRSFSGLVLACCVERANRNPHERVLGLDVRRWRDGITHWLRAEKDVRGFVPGKGWAHCIAHGADAIGCLAQTPAFDEADLARLLELVADRVLLPCGTVWTAGEVDRLAAATVIILGRDIVAMTTWDSWIARLVEGATKATPVAEDPFETVGNAEAFLRALHLQVLLAPEPPDRGGDLANELGPDMIRALGAAVRTANPHYLSARR